MTAAAPAPRKRTAPRKPGNIEALFLAEAAEIQSLHPMRATLIAMSTNLAKTLDEGAGLATAAVNRELRANLAELARMGVPEDEDLSGELSTPS
jgi:hypothetical protein